MTTPESASTSNGGPGEYVVVLVDHSPDFQNGFCSQCSDIEGKLRQLVMADPLSSGHELRYGRGIVVRVLRSAETKCSLCRFFRTFSGNQTGHSAIEEDLRLRLSLVPLVSSTTMFLVPPQRRDSDAADNLKYIALGLDNDGPRSKLGYSTMLFRQGLLVPKISAGSSTAHTWPRPLIPFPQVSEVDSFAVSFPSILGWLQKCETEHNACRRTTSLLSSGLPKKFIDCDSPTLQIVAVSGLVDYLALSYVWGSPQVLKDGGIPEVVQDAITVTKRLGKRYLWVDKYCVEQENHGLRAQEIQAMDMIYEGAYATIIACAGSDATFGLPGVGGRWRNWQPQVAISPDVSLISTLPPLHDVLRRSTWITRGWTYQEAILSRRAIFFTHSQVYFACGRMRCSEALPVPELLHQHGLGRHLSQDASFPSLISNLLSPSPVTAFQIVGEQLEQNMSSLEILMNHISRYTSRHLSYDEDILNALRAILRRSPVSSFWGIPIATYDKTTDPTTMTPRNVELGFLPNLFWNPEELGWDGHSPLLRRQGFPSWSWSGWKGPIIYVFKGRETRPIPNPEKCRGISISADLTTGDTLPIEQLHKRYGSQGFVPEITPYLRLQTLVIQVRFNSGGSPPSPIRPIFLCDCHPTALHHPSVERPPDRWPSPTFCHAGGYSERGLNRIWDCALLFVAGNPDFDEGSIWAFLIIEWNADRTTAFRVGTLDITELPSYKDCPHYPGYEVSCESEEGFGNFSGFNFQRDLLEKVPHSWQSIRLG